MRLALILSTTIPELSAVGLQVISLIPDASYRMGRSSLPPVTWGLRILSPPVDWTNFQSALWDRNQSRRPARLGVGVAQKRNMATMLGIDRFMVWVGIERDLRFQARGVGSA